MSEIIPFENKLGVPEEYAGMLSIIGETMPEVQRATALFNKQQSQFMDDMLTVSHLTPIRNLRQILAEMKRTRQALGEAYYSIQKKQIEIEEKREEKIDSSPLKQKRLNLEIEEIEWQISCIRENVSGAIRKLTNYSQQYKAIQDHHGLENFTEQDFEEEEERYHICKAFEQGLNAARAHGGRIDEGNQIYFSQIGINGTAAQQEMLNYFKLEDQILKRGELPTHEFQIAWLLSMAEKFKGCSVRFAKWKGMSGTITQESLV